MLTVCPRCNWDLFVLSALKCKISAKNDPERLKNGTYFTIFRREQQAFSALFSDQQLSVEMF